jgi:hypothetical protein
MTVGTTLLAYKLAVVASGTFSLFLGYSLFRHGIFESAGDFDARFKDNRLVLKQAAPGVFFALFGTAVLGFTIAKGFSLESGETLQMSNAQRNLIGDLWIHIGEDETLETEAKDQYLEVLGGLLEQGSTGSRGLASE